MSKRYKVKQVSKQPKRFAIWDSVKEQWVRHMQQDDQPIIESPYPFELEKIKKRLRK